MIRDRKKGFKRPGQGSSSASSSFASSKGEFDLDIDSALDEIDKALEMTADKKEAKVREKKTRDRCVC